MQNTRGWDIAVLAAMAVLCVLLAVNDTTGAELAGGLTAVGCLGLVWFTLGRRGAESTAGAVAAPLLILLGGVATAVSPSLATMQAILFPVLWMITRSVRAAVIANALLAVSVGTGYAMAFGGTVDAITEAVVIEAISFSGSLAIGFWIARISEESDERERLLGELRETQELLARASRDAGMVGERERLARELHDTIAQDLTGLVLLVQRVRREVRSGDPLVGETLDLLEDGARATLAETRSLVAVNAPVGLATDGIAGALTRLGERIERETGISVELVIDDPGGATLDRDAEVVLLRCAQEGLANVRRHAAATSCVVRLRIDSASATLTVRDDGAGFDPERPRTGFGLDGLTDRLALVGGRLDVDSAPGRGTTLSVALPRVGADA